MSLPVLHRSPPGPSPGEPVTTTVEPQDSSESERVREQLVDEQLAQSFPASDPPSWVQGTVPVRG
ncbi:MAG: hypothetical protein ACREPQ_04410 [Rhodanobacter sp.]